MIIVSGKLKLPILKSLSLSNLFEILSNFERNEDFN